NRALPGPVPPPYPPPPIAGAIAGVPNVTVLLESLATSWSTVPLLIQVTELPACTVSVSGVNWYSMMATVGPLGPVADLHAARQTTNAANRAGRMERSGLGSCSE